MLNLHDFSGIAFVRKPQVHPMSGQGIRKISTFGSRLTSTVSVCLVLLLMGVAAMIALAARSVGDDVRRNLGFTVRMERGCDSIAVRQLSERIAADRGVESAVYLSADSILAAETAALGGDLALEAGANPYSAEIEVRVRPSHANADSIDAMAAVYEMADGVDEIVSERAVIAGVERTMNRLRLVLIIIAAILLCVSIALINNTVSLSIYSRRFTIHTMRLVGATAGFIRAPFVRAGAVNGLVAGLGASALLCLLRAYGATVDPIVAECLPWTSMAAVCAGAIVAGIAICALTSYFATNRYLAISYDEMFLK